MSALPISVIDDDESTRAALAGLLRMLGYAVATYGSAEEFLADGAARPSCCVISDVHMPGLTGVELKRRLDASGQSTPFILITGRSEPRLLADAAASGAVCLLRKPFDAEALIAGLRRAQIHQA